MRFALLGADAESQALADAAVATGHALVWPAAGTPDADAGWEDLFDAEIADAIIVGAGGDSVDLRVRQMQELAKQGRPLLTVHPVVPSVISFFEVDMARTESGALVRHFNPLVESPRIAEFAAWIAAGHPELGPIEQIVATRQLGDRSPETVLWHFARDAELLAQLAGRLDRIGAHAAMGDADAAYASLSVQLLGPRQVPVRWSVEPLARGTALSLSIICGSGRVTVEFDAAGALRDDSPGPTPAEFAINRFVAAANSGDHGASTWPAALDAMELADSIEISLRRGRMIDVHHRELTETLAFKGVMSALGCGVLVVLVPLMLALGWIAGILGIPMSEYWPHLLLVLLAGFLALQLLPKLMAPRGRPGASDAGEREPPADSAD